MMNMYNGNILTDGEGRARILLPDYFEALNTDFRYQLTVVGEPTLVSVEREIENNSFVIRSDRPNVKVSWLVTGVRKDASANANRRPVEEWKPKAERGKFLDPEAFGAGKGDRVQFARFSQGEQCSVEEAAQVGNGESLEKSSDLVQRNR